MAYLTITRITGEPAELRPAYEATSSFMAGVGKDHGLILHGAAETEDGLLVVNVWGSEEGSAAAFRDPRRRGVVDHHGLTPDRFHKEHHELIECVQLSAAGGAGAASIPSTPATARAASTSS